MSRFSKRKAGYTYRSPVARDGTVHLFFRTLAITISEDSGYVVNIREAENFDASLCRKSGPYDSQTS